MSSNTKTLKPLSERIQLLLQEDLNNWENNFCLSLMTWVTNPRCTGLSEKQSAKLRDMESDFGLSRYAGEGPELNLKDIAVIRPAPYVRPPESTKRTLAKEDITSLNDDDEDDIPF